MSAKTAKAKTLDEVEESQPYNFYPGASFPNPKKLKLTKHEVEELTNKFTEDNKVSYYKKYSKILADKKEKADTFTYHISPTTRDKIPVTEASLKALVDVIQPPRSTRLTISADHYERKSKSKIATGDYEAVTLSDGATALILEMQKRIYAELQNKLQNCIDASKRKRIKREHVLSLIPTVFSTQIANHIMHNSEERLGEFIKSFMVAEESSEESEEENKDRDGESVLEGGNESDDTNSDETSESDKSAADEITTAEPMDVDNAEKTDD